MAKRPPNKIAYFGTPKEAVPPLLALAEAGFEISLVITGEDKPKGRGQKISSTPVKLASEELGLPISHNPNDVISGAISSEPQIGVVVAYGKLIKPPVLSKMTLINMHFSLLPLWRGAAPVERAILAGDQKTGVCLMKLEETLDTGPVYSRYEIEIKDTHTTETLKQDLIEGGTKLLLELLSSKLPEPQPQEMPKEIFNELSKEERTKEITQEFLREKNLWAEKITRADLKIDLASSAKEILRQIRAGGAWIDLKELKVNKDGILKIHDACIAKEIIGEEKPQSLTTSPLFEKSGDIYLATADLFLKLIAVQPEGKKSMPASDWHRGLPKLK